MDQFFNFLKCNSQIRIGSSLPWEFQGPLAGLESDRPPEEVLEFLKEEGQVVGRGKLECRWVNTGPVPVASRSSVEAANTDELSLRLCISMGIAI